MYRKTQLAVAGVAVGVLAWVAAVPAGAQEPLGFEVDRTEGSPGDEVTGQVDVDDVAEHCNHDVDELQVRFNTTQDALVDVRDDYFPDGTPVEGGSVENFEQIAAYLMWFTAGQVDAEADEVLPQTFVMTFADIATQNPVGEQVNYDPQVGEATVPVPDVTPGNWAVAGTCVSPSVDSGVLHDSVAVNAELIEEIFTSSTFEEEVGFPWDHEFFGGGFPITITSEWNTLVLLSAGAFGEQLIPALMEPDAFGAEIFCVLNADGECPDQQVDPGDPGHPGDPDDPTAPEAPRVPGEPALTG